MLRLYLVLYAAFIVGLITALIGGRPGMISGATGALAVVMVALVMDHGAQYLFATVVLMGILQLIAGIFKLGKFIRMVPEPVMLGFVNGLAIVIGISQLSQFKTINALGDSVLGYREYIALFHYICRIYDVYYLVFAKNHKIIAIYISGNFIYNYFSFNLKN